MDRANVTARLEGFLETECDIVVPAAHAELDIDSFHMTLIISFVNAELGVALDMEELDFDAFTSLESLTNLVMKAEAT